MPSYAGLRTGQVAYGSVEGTGSAIEVDLGFQPKVVLLRNIDGNATLDWVEGMGDDKGQKVVTSAAGTTDISFIASGGVTQNSDGFTIGTDADINANAETIVYVALG